jgi:hypothetical protein
LYEAASPVVVRQKPELQQVLGSVTEAVETLAPGRVQ